MNLKQKLKRELAAVGSAALYFGCWIGSLLFIKHLVLEEYHIEFRHYSMAFVGALILSKVVLVLENVSLGMWVRRQPAWVDVVLRTALYAFGVVVVMALEKGIEGRQEAGGLGNAVKAALQSSGAAHLWANTICISGALLGYNMLSVIRRNLGPGGLRRSFMLPVRDSASSHDPAV